MFDTEKFIGEVEKRPAVYNANLKEYCDRDLKNKCWEEIGKEMYWDWHILAKEDRQELGRGLQTKWKSIRDHWKKEMRQKKTGKHHKKKGYIYFDKLRFLLALYENKNVSSTMNVIGATPNVIDSTSNVTDTTSNVTDTTSNVIGASSNVIEATPNFIQAQEWREIGNGCGQIRIESVESASASRALPRNKNKRHHDDDDDSSVAVKRIRDILSQGAFQKEGRESDRTGNKAFLMSLLPLMDKLPVEAVIEVRVQLMQVLQNAFARQNCALVSSPRDYKNVQLIAPTVNHENRTSYDSNDSEFSNSDSGGFYFQAI